MPMNVAVDSVVINAAVRIELIDFIPALPPFKVLSVQCMQQPEVDLSLKIASLDVMNAGMADFSLVKLLNSILKSYISGI
jgi:hypothetical protein